MLAAVNVETLWILLHIVVTIGRSIAVTDTLSHTFAHCHISTPAFVFGPRNMYYIMLYH